MVSLPVQLRTALYIYSQAYDNYYTSVQLCAAPALVAANRAKLEKAYDQLELIFKDLSRDKDALLSVSRTTSRNIKCFLRRIDAEASE